MLSIPGRPGQNCDGFSRRELLRVGGAGLIGLSLPEFLRMQATAAPTNLAIAPKAKSVILLFLQGGPSHIDIWDPKPDAPANIRGEFKPIKTKVDGIQVSETMPMMAEQLDKVTMIRSMSYTPAGLFNHTAAIYQMMTGWAPDKVSPSGQLEPPSPRDFPHMGCHLSKMRPPEGPMLPFVEMPRPLQESSVIGKGGAAGGRPGQGLHSEREVTGPSQSSFDRLDQGPHSGQLAQRTLQVRALSSGHTLRQRCGRLGQVPAFEEDTPLAACDDRHELLTCGQILGRSEP